MTRLSPKEIYKASVKCLKTNTSKDMHTDGARLDYYMKHPDFLVTVRGASEKPVYPVIDRLAGTNFKAQTAEVTA